MVPRHLLSRNFTRILARSFTPQQIPRSLSMPSSVDMAKVAVRRLHATAKHLQPVSASTVALRQYPTTHERIESPGDTPWFIDNQFVPSKASQWIDLHDPATNNLVTRVPQSTTEELKAAVKSANQAFPAWKATSVMTRQ